MNKHLVAAGLVVAFSLAMVIAAADGNAGGTCGAAPHELVIRDPECRAPSSNEFGSDTSARNSRSADSGLGWFLASVVVGLAALAALAIESPTTRPFPGPRPDGVRI